jgi:hypothetical protein
LPTRSVGTPERGALKDAFTSIRLSLTVEQMAYGTGVPCRAGHWRTPFLIRRTGHSIGRLESG